MDCYNRRKMDNKYQFVQKQSIINNSKTLFLLFYANISAKHALFADT